MTLHIDSNDLIKRLVEDAVAAELHRLAMVEAAQWAFCFGKNAPKDRQKQIDRIVRTASAMALSAEMRTAAYRDETDIIAEH